MLAVTFLRVRAHRLLFGAALLTVLLTTCVLATLAAFTGAIGDAGLRRTLGHQQAASATVDVTANVTAADLPAVDRFVRATSRAAFDGLPTTVRASVQSGPFGLPAAARRATGPAAAPSGGDQPDLTLFATFDPARIVLVSGRLPGPVARSTGTVPVALPEISARALGVRPGSLLTLADRLGGPRVRIRVTGTFRPKDPAAAYWRLDPLDGKGVETVGFTTYGPLLTDPSAFGSGRLGPAAVSWQTTAAFGSLTTAGIGPLGDRVSRAVSRIDNHSPDNAAQASSALPGLLRQMRLTLLTGRSTLLIDALQLAVLAAVALLLVAGLLAAEHAGESAVLRARGASGRQLAGLAGVEALLIAVPSGLLAPLLAGPLVRLLATHGALAATGIRLGTGSLSGAAEAWPAALGTALACGLAVVAPTLRRAGSYVGERSARLRMDALPAAVRAGADVALLAVAGVAYWQLEREASGSGALTTDAAGRLGVDPVLVAAPALCQLAGTLVALRLLPLVARLVERRAARGRGLVPALAGWQLSRRPRRGTAPALLIVLAIAMGMFAIGQNASWQRSQDDQAAFTAGTDIRVTGSSLPPFGQGGSFEALRDRHTGVTSVMPAVRSVLPLAQGRMATVLAVDAASAADTLRLRPDLGRQPLPKLLRPLYAAQDAPGRRDTAGFVIPSGASALRLTVRLQQLGAGQPAGPLTESVNVTLKDRYGVAYAFYVGDLAADGRDHVLVADLAGAAGIGGSPAGPLRLTGIEGDHDITPHGARLRLSVTDLSTVAANGAVRRVPEPGDPADRRWHARSAADSTDFLAGARGFRSPRAGAATSTAAVPLSVVYDTGSQPAPGGGMKAPTGEITLTAASPPAPQVTAVATDAFLRASGTPVGGQVQVQLSGTQFPVRITGAVRALPTTQGSGPGLPGDDAGPDGDGTADASGSDGGALLVDLGSVNRMLDQLNAFSLQPTEWWLATAPGAAPRIESALRSDSRIDSLVSVDDVRSALRSDPLGAGPQSALPALVIAAAVLAAVGFAVSALGAVRERDSEFALLRALGAPRSRLARMIAAEQGVVALVAIVVGAALGELLTRLVVPLVVLTDQATAPVPPLIVELPAGPVLRMLAAVLALPVLVIAVTALRGGDPAAALRQQEEN